ncbi:MAG: xanthine dehydrogenase family protein subunit M [Pseudomonadota bacterium]|nr:xanthine dehydrogenase family protein subunit M [Pseudomonadota bacterium]
MLTCTAPVHRVSTLAEALAQRAAHPDATVLAGGTDLMVFLELGSVNPPAILDLWGCTELRGISEDGHTLGALSTWTDVARHPALPAALRDCARTVGAPQIQNRGTIGGNIVNASPAGDSLPMWLAMDAQFELASVRGVRQVPASAFWLGYRKTALAADELLTRVHLRPHADDRLHYRKVGTRLAQAISKVVLGARLRVVDGVVTEARVALGSVAPTPIRAHHVEAALVGRPLDAAAADAVAHDIAPIDDIRSTADYRRTVAANVIRAWLRDEAARSPDR